jgi:hypothetical protein
MIIVTSKEVPHAREGEIAFELTVRIGDGDPFRLSTISGIPIRVRHFGDRFQIAQIRELFAVGATICAPITHLDPGSQRAPGYRRTDRAVDPKLINPVGRAIVSAKPAPIHVAHVPGEIMFNAGDKMGQRAV